MQLVKEESKEQLKEKIVKDKSKKKDKSLKAEKKPKKDKKSKKRTLEETSNGDSVDISSNGTCTNGCETKIKRQKLDAALSSPVVAENTNGDVDDVEILTEEQKKGSFSNFPIGKKTVQLLKAKGVKYLFPVQVQTFMNVFEGHDSIVQARTGTGKTLAFAIPLVEKLSGIQRERGRRPPLVLVMAPTRELAKQVCEDFEAIGPQLSITCIYGGTAYGPQEGAIRRGLDVLVGTPGRILDYVQKGALDLSHLKHVVLDEVDRMLDMGFTESVEEILSAAYKMDKPESHPQTLFFSATLPSWVHQTAKKYMRLQAKKVDLIGQQELKTSETVEHLAIRCGYMDRAKTLSDVVQVYSGQHGRTMIFCDAKKEANELSLSSVLRQEVQVLHGDIVQRQREMTLKGFRDGKFRCLIATDVAARGLDVPEVDLVVQLSPPKDRESYIHRSGRTGRAGRTGICVCFYTPREEGLIKLTERRTGIKFKRIGAPRAEDIVRSSAKDAARFIEAVSNEVTQHFQTAAEMLIKEKGAVSALAAALAHISGASEIKHRSLLSSQEGYTTYLFSSEMEMRTKSYIWSTLGYALPENVKSSIRGMRMCADRKGALFDVPNEHIKTLESQWQDCRGVQLTVAKEIPELLEEAGYGNGGNDTGFQGRGRGGYNNRWGNGGGGSNGRGRWQQQNRGGFRNNNSWQSNGRGGKY